MVRGQAIEIVERVRVLRNPMKPIAANPMAIIAQVDGSGTPTRLNSNASPVEENDAVVNGVKPVIVTSWLPRGLP